MVFFSIHNSCYTPIRSAHRSVMRKYGYEYYHNHTAFQRCSVMYLCERMRLPV